jgi:hypothetical protein
MAYEAAARVCDPGPEKEWRKSERERFFCFN